MMGDPIKMNDLGVPLFSETPTYSPFNDVDFHGDGNIPWVP